MPGARDRDTGAVDPELTMILARHVLRGRALSALAVGGVVAVMIGRITPRLLIVWTALVVAEAITDAVAARPITRRVARGEPDPRWVRRAAFHCALFGLTWGSLPVLAAIDGRPDAFWLSTLIVLAALTMTVVTLSASRLLFSIGTTGFIGQAAAASVTSPAAPGRLALLTVAFGAIAIAVHGALHRTLVESLRAKQDAQRLSEQLTDFMAARDPVTGLLNRRSFIAKLDDVLSRGDGRVLTVEVGNVRRLTSINELYGEQFGDALIAHVGERLGVVDERDGFAGRLSGDEFVLARFADKAELSIRTLAAGSFSSLGGTATVDFSCASVRATTAARRAEELVIEAVFALRAGEPTHPARYLRAHGEPLVSRRELVEELRGGLPGAGVQPWFQPIVNATTRQVIGWEALVRWPHRSLGVMLPDRLLPLLEVAGSGDQLLELTLARSLSFLMQLDSIGARAHTVHVNVDAADLRAPAIADMVIGTIRDADVSADRVVLELTERAILDVDENVRSALGQLAGQGVSVAVDDFGTGYSSLSHLLDFPAGQVKIDRRFIDGLAAGTSAHTLVKGVISMAHGLGRTTIAEGVESRAAADIVRALGCDHVQGFLISPARPASNAINWWMNLSPSERGATTRVG